MRNTRRRTRAVAAVFTCATVALFIAVRAGAAPTERTILAASDGADGDQLGTSVAVFGDTAVVGAPVDVVGTAASQGSAYVFTRASAAWTQRKKLVADDGAANDRFGQSAALVGDTAVLGAQGVAGQTGAVYVFTGSGASWTQQAKLTADDGTTFDRLGTSVALDGNTLVAGAPGDLGFRGAAYVFTRTGTVWTQQAKLTASDGADSDQFGAAVAIAGNTIVVGATSRDAALKPNQGAAYVFTRVGVAWTERKILVPDDGTGEDAFGTSVAMSGGTVVVGAQLHTVGQNANQGAAYVFTGFDATWTQQAQLHDAAGSASDSFGASVAVDGDTALVGSIFSDSNPPANNQGAAFLYKRDGAQWTPQPALTASDLSQSDQFGIAVALHDGTSIIGAVGKSNFRGGAYAFDGLPASELLVRTLKGSIVDSAKSGKDSISVKCSVEFREGSDGAFDPATEALQISVGNASSQFAFGASSGDPAVKTKVNMKKHTVTHTWKTAKGVRPKASFKLFLPATGPATLTANVSSADLAAGTAAPGLIRVELDLGVDDGSDDDAWRTKGTKRLFP